MSEILSVEEILCTVVEVYFNHDAMGSPSIPYTRYLIATGLENRVVLDGPLSDNPEHTMYRIADSASVTRETRKNMEGRVYSVFYLTFA